MRVQHTRTKQLRAPLTTTIQKVCSAISTHVRSIINLILGMFIVCTYLNLFLMVKSF